MRLIWSHSNLKNLSPSVWSYSPLLRLWGWTHQQRHNCGCLAEGLGRSRSDIGWGWVSLLQWYESPRRAYHRWVARWIFLQIWLEESSSSIRWITPHAPSLSWSSLSNLAEHVYCIMYLMSKLEGLSLIIIHDSRRIKPIRSMSIKMQQLSIHNKLGCILDVYWMHKVTY